MTQIYHQSYSFTMVEENFEYWPSELSKMNQFYHRVYHFFTIMVDENFEIWHIIFFQFIELKYGIYGTFSTKYGTEYGIYGNYGIYGIYELCGQPALCIKFKVFNFRRPLNVFLEIFVKLFPYKSSSFNFEREANESSSMVVMLLSNSCNFVSPLNDENISFLIFPIMFSDNNNSVRFFKSTNAL